MKLTQGLLFTIAAAFAATASAETLEIGALPAADSAVLYVAEAEGLFQKEGLDVKVVPFKSALEIGAAMRAGRLDGHFGDLMNVFTQNETGIKQKVVLTTTHTHPEQRCFGMLVSPKVKKYEKLGDLDGTSTAMSSSTIIDYLLDRNKRADAFSGTIRSSTKPSRSSRSRPPIRMKRPSPPSAAPWPPPRSSWKKSPTLTVPSW